MTNLLSRGLLLTAFALAASPAAAQWAPWCLSESGNRGSGAVTCTFYSFEQCMATLMGIGGSCGPNPYAAHGTPYPGGGQGRKSRQYR